MKKIVICLGIFVLLLLSMFLIYQYSPRKMIKASREEITRVIVINGNNGNVIDLGEKDIDELYKEISKVKIKRIINPEESSGWSYSFKLFHGNELLVNAVINGEQCSIDGVKYLVQQKQIKKIEALLEKFEHGATKSDSEENN
ncbi:MAG: hypothetical protein K6G64_02625 [Eubacterium sp.]|nr:hypothetical protein [Eubacterium sp.]